MAADARAVRLELLRTALVVGLLLYAAVAWFVHRNATPAPDTEYGVLRSAAWLLIGATVIAMPILRMLITRATTWHRAVTLTIVAWCIAELPALFGATYYLLTGSAAIFAAGTLAFVAALLFIGIPGQD